MTVDLTDPLALRVCALLFVYRLIPKLIDFGAGIYMGFRLARRGVVHPNPCDNCIRPAASYNRWTDRFRPPPRPAPSPL